MAELIEMPFGLWTEVCPRKHCIRWGPDPQCQGEIIKGRDMPRHARRHSAISCAEMAVQIDLPFGLWTRVGRRKHSSIIFARWHQCALIGALWWIWLNCTSETVMWPFVKLRWPFVLGCADFLEREPLMIIGALSVTQPTVWRHWRELKSTEDNHGILPTGSRSFLTC